ncbi:hypothetical protein SARC_00373 [Sphaeroforma arctica JP610]|uniref:Uncharacterized protein n=1 Tax=Sphaeroforma arctica JP610 TaxID=667725 RepID=A0A0L0GFB2_9EUKA|nr:hypothetical protein SARC_00373 [Sphaeroforma arctica JP610]KNC87549.1 hypothetical protein SARC_00373 [Sphaeroforma arctica JP610]|eukprot:XP_014161451.1 hypothetical protein SARC_00373 [Sphaeroforma arctica JP610]
MHIPDSIKNCTDILDALEAQCAVELERRSLPSGIQKSMIVKLAVPKPDEPKIETKYISTNEEMDWQPSGRDENFYRSNDRSIKIKIPNLGINNDGAEDKLHTAAEPHKHQSRKNNNSRGRVKKSTPKSTPRSNTRNVWRKDAIKPPSDKDHTYVHVPVVLEHADTDDDDDYNSFAVTDSTRAASALDMDDNDGAKSVDLTLDVCDDDLAVNVPAEILRDSVDGPTASMEESEDDFVVATEQASREKRKHNSRRKRHKSRTSSDDDYLPNTDRRRHGGSSHSGKFLKQSWTHQSVPEGLISQPSISRRSVPDLSAKKRLAKKMKDMLNRKKSRFR